jgi:hypothetical protein
MTDDPSRFDGPLLAGRFRLGRTLGRGGQGTARLALDTRTDTRVAVKTLVLKDLKEWKSLDLFRREAQVLRACQHPGIPRFIEEISDPDGTQMHLVMEFVPGQTLAQRSKLEGPLGEAALWRLMVQAADVLAYLHTQPVPMIHRDVKPGNLIERPDGTLALVDFGTVHQRAAELGGNTFVGTLGFMAPEQLHGDATPATDMYGLGATLVALGTGVDPEQLPHDGLRIRYADRMTTSPALKAILDRLLEPEPGQRLKSGVELKKLLEDATRLSKAEPTFPDTLDTGAAGPLTLPSGFLSGVPAPILSVLSLALGILGMGVSLGVLMVDRLIIPVVFLILAAVNPDRKQKMDRAEELAHRVTRQLMLGVKDVGGTLLTEARHQRQVARAERQERKVLRNAQKDGRREEQKYFEREERARQAAMKQRNAHRNR